MHYKKLSMNEEPRYTEQQYADFEAAARPLIQWLNENCHPHNRIAVTHTGAELLEGQVGFRTDEYLRD